MRPWLAAALLASLGGGALRVQPPPEPGSRPSLLLITVDTLRPDALGWVAGKNATPSMDRLALRGFRFPAAVSPAPLTLPSHAAIMTGVLPRRLGLRDNGQVLGAAPATLAETLRRRGYATAAFVSGYPLDSTFGLDRGFSLYDDTLGPVPGAEGDLERPAAATAAAARAWLRSAPRPFFAWVHFYDPHHPYAPPAEHRRAGPRGDYDGEVAYVDREVGTLVDALGGAGQGNVLTVLAGDHGESLGEHGEGTHGFFVYDSTVLVPLVFHFPGRVAPGASPAPARLVDLAPTLLELLGLPALGGLDGISLGRILAGGREPSEPAYVETYQPWLSYGWSPLRSIRHRGFKLIDAPRPELFSLEADPGEKTNLAASEPVKLAELRRLLDQAVSLPAAVAETVLDDEAVARLRALGYVGAGSSAAEPPERGLRDPKDGAALRDLMTEADRLLRRGELRGGVSRLDEVLSLDPENRFALHRSGVALLRLGDLRAALPRLRHAVELDPKRPEYRAALAEGLGLAGQPAAAVEQWLEATRLQPRRAEAWANLGSALGLDGKPPQAVAALLHAVELEPREGGFLARLAFAEHAAGRIPDAVRHLGDAAALAGPEGFRYSGALGLLLLRLERPEEARGWLGQSRPGEAEFAQARLELAILEAGAGRVEPARRALAEALRADPGLRSRAAADARLAPLLP